MNDIDNFISKLVAKLPTSNNLMQGFISTHEGLNYLTVGSILSKIYSTRDEILKTNGDWQEWLEKIKKDLSPRYEDISTINPKEFKDMSTYYEQALIFFKTTLAELEDRKQAYDSNKAQKEVIEKLTPVLAQSFPPFVHIGDLIYFYRSDKVDPRNLPLYIDNGLDPLNSYYLLLVKTRIYIPDGIAYIIINACYGRPNTSNFYFLDKL